MTSNGRNLSVDDISKHGKNAKYISEGAFGIVYETELELFGTERRKYAVKRLDDTESENEIDDFKKEAVMNSMCRHQNIVTCFGFLDNKNPRDRKVTMIMEPYGKHTLYDVLMNEDIKMETKDCLKILIQICKAVYYLHYTKKEPLVHLDLKPQNVLVGDDNIVKLCDFGSAIRYKNVKILDCVVGTPQYMAPEIINTLSSPDDLTLCDVYSFGILMWGVFTRKDPYEKYVNLDVSKLQYDVLTRNVRPNIKSVSIKHGDRITNLIKKCWDSDPKKRPATFDEIKCELKSELLMYESPKRRKMRRSTTNHGEKSMKSNNNFRKSFKREEYFHIQGKKIKSEKFSIERKFSTLKTKRKKKKSRIVPRPKSRYPRIEINHHATYYTINQFQKLRRNNNKNE